MQSRTIRWCRYLIIIGLAFLVTSWEAIDVWANIAGTWTGIGTITACNQDNLCSGGPARIGSTYPVQYTFVPDSDTGFHGSILYGSEPATFTGTLNGTSINLSYKYTNAGTHGPCFGTVTGDSMTLTCDAYLGPPHAPAGSFSRFQSTGEEILQCVSGCRPVIDHLSPIADIPGKPVTVTGQNFGTLTGVVTFSGFPAQLVGTWSDTQLQVIVPHELIDKTYQVQVTTNSELNSNTVPFEVPKPTIEVIEPPRGAHVGADVTFIGNNLVGPGTKQCLVDFIDPDTGRSALPRSDFVSCLFRLVPATETHIGFTVPDVDAKRYIIIVTIDERKSLDIQFTVLPSGGLKATLSGLILGSVPTCGGAVESDGSPITLEITVTNESNAPITVASINDCQEFRVFPHDTSPIPPTQNDPDDPDGPGKRKYEVMVVPIQPGTRTCSIEFHNNGEPPIVGQAVSVQAVPSGDVNCDGRIDCRDWANVLLRLGSRTGQRRYDPAADIDGDGRIELADVRYVRTHIAPGTPCQ